MAYDIGPKIGIEGEKEFRKAITDINTSMKTLGTEMMAVTSAYDKNDKSIDALSSKNDVLNKQVNEQKNKLSELTKGLAAAAEKYGENDKVTQGWQQSVNKATADLNNMERELKQNIEAMEEASNKGGKFTGMLSGLGEGLKGIAGTAGKATITGIKALGTAAVAAGAGLVAMVEGTKEYRTELSMLEQNAKTSGNSLSAMKEELSSITAITDDNGAAVEALSNLMATGFDDNQMTQAVEALSGAMIKFPDTLKIEGLADGLQETLATGKAIGPFAELIERMGGDLEEFDEAMAGATTEAEKQQVALDWLAKSGLAEVNAQYRETNKEALSAAEAQFKMNDAMAGLATVVEPSIATLKGGLADVMTSLVGVVTGTDGATEDFKNSISNLATNTLEMVTELIPTLSTTMEALLPALIEGIMTALPALGEAATNIMLMLVTQLVDSLPQLIPVALDIIMTLMDGLITALPELIPAVIALIILLTTELINRIPEILKFVPELFLNLAEAFGEIDWASLGSDLMKGIVNGIVDLKDWVVEKVKEVAGNIAQGFKDFFGIASPSKLMAEYGKNLDEGLAQGVTENKGIPLGAITAVGQEMANAAKSAARTVMDLLTIDGDSFSISGSGGTVSYSSGNSRSQSQREKDLANFKDEIYAVANSNKVDISTGYEMWKSNQVDKIYGRDETYSSKNSSKGITQNITINSPKALSPSETAKTVAKTTQKLVLGLLR